MQEFEVYLPTKRNDGSAVDPATIESIKAELVTAFGGYTHFAQRSEGAWRIGGVTFYDDVTILRVLDHGGANFDMSEFKLRLEKQLEQETILIIAREVTVVG